MALLTTIGWASTPTTWFLNFFSSDLSEVGEFGVDRRAGVAEVDLPVHDLLEPDVGVAQPDADRERGVPPSR